MRVLDLLEVLAASPEALSLSDLARRLAIPKSSASALLATLARRGYVTRNGGSRTTAG
ncbi:MAG: helix-turn-helix domain-containing protein [Candidatus Rokubacteria bacterium]|nr:helix-turn-helix domain-containing protein [Candidatus Rokubacteria bacterium]